MKDNRKDDCKKKKKKRSSQETTMRPITSFFEKAVSTTTTTTRATKPSSSSSSSAATASITHSKCIATTTSGAVAAGTAKKSSTTTTTTSGNNNKRSLEQIMTKENKPTVKRTLTTTIAASITSSGAASTTTSNTNRYDESILKNVVAKKKKKKKKSDDGFISAAAVLASTTTEILTTKKYNEEATTNTSTTTVSTSVSLSSSQNSSSEEEIKQPKIIINNNNNVMEQLMQRSTLGGKRSIMKNKNITPCSSFNTKSLPPWKTTSWILLQQSQSASADNSYSGTLGNHHYHLLAWDHVGVLLAVVSMNQKYMYIYDWDSVLAADIQGRNKRLRYKTHQQHHANQQQHGNDETADNHVSSSSSPGCLFSVEATMIIPLSSLGRTFQAMVWNPYNPDEFVMVHREGYIDLYDLGQVAEWQEQHCGANISGGPPRYPPHKRILADIPIGSSPFSVLFVRDNNNNGQLDCSIILASGCHVVCYSKLWSKTPTLQWKLSSWNKRISSLATVHHTNLVAVGCTNGNIVLMDWKRVQKASFARHFSPTLVAEWSTCRGIPCPTAGNTEWMGVHQLHVETGWCGQPETNQGTRKLSSSSSSNILGHCHFSWFTSCGWALSMTVDVSGYKTTDTKSQVQYATNHVRFQNSNGNQLGEDKNMWSLPAERVKGSGTDSVLCWEKVADVTQILARGRDDRVLDGPLQSTTIRSCSAPTTLLWMPRSGEDPVRSIPLSNKKKRSISITSIAIHPSHEWIVVGTDTEGLRIYNARNKV